jgi:geranylgeranyl transferase type-1 subunit beta
LIGKLDVFNTSKAQQYLLQMTQHRIGGFSKYPDDPPDIFHSYMGLAALSMLGHQELKPIHPAACMSMDAVQYLEDMARSDLET